MMRFSMLLCISLVASCEAVGSKWHGARFMGRMNPDMVAHTLVEVEEKWLQQATAFAQCNATTGECADGVMADFEKSCQTVVQAVVQGSNGDKHNVKEYLNDVCEDHQMQGWKKDLCGNLTTALDNALSEDVFSNREELNLTSICSNFMSHGFLKEAVKEEKIREEHERKRIEEEEKEAKERAEEEARAEEARKKAEEAQAKADAAAQAAKDAAAKRDAAKAKKEEAAKKDAEAAAAEAAKQQADAEANATVAAAAEARQRVANRSVNASVPASRNVTESSPEPAQVNKSAPIVSGNATSALAANITQSKEVNATVAEHNSTAK